MRSGMVGNFVPFRQNPSYIFGMRNNVGTYHEERHFSVALFQNVEQSGGGARTWSVVKGHSNVRAVNVTGAISTRFERAWSGSR